MIPRGAWRADRTRRLSTTALLATVVCLLYLGGLVVAFSAGGDHSSGAVLSGDITGCALNPAKPKRQFRAMWITSVGNRDWPSREGLDQETIKAEYLSWLDIAQRDHFNAVIVMIRAAADSFWPSRYEPWSQYLTGVRGRDPGWDPLEFLVAETHRRNLEFHAWINPYRASTPAPRGAGIDINRLAPGHPLRSHPGWAVAYPANARGQLYYNPGVPEARRFIEDAMLDAVARYDVDAVHFDDFFYPYPGGNGDFPDEATYAKYGGGFRSKADWRRNNVDMLIREMHQRVHDLKPWVKFGVSPFAIWRNESSDPRGSPTSGNQSYTANFADTRTWVKRGWLDYIVPQVYWYIGFDTADYAKLVPWWSDIVAGTSVQLYIGQATYRAGTSGGWRDPGELSAHLTLNRKYPQVLGDVHFSARHVRADRGGAVTRMVADHYSAPALVPSAGNARARPRSFPIITGSTRVARTGVVKLSWKAPASKPDRFETITSYALYRFDGSKAPGRCGFVDASHLIGTTRESTFTDYTAEPGHRYTYYVTALDRVWRESDASPARVVK